MGDYTFIQQGDSTPDRLRSGHSICNRCGMIVEQGIMNFAEHESDYHTEKVVYTIPSDNELRIRFMEFDMPTSIYRCFGFAEPTKTEKEIYKK